MPAALFVVVALVAITAPKLMAEERTPPGSFLKYRATSIDELASQVARNTAVRIRFAEHFGVSPDQVADYFAKNLTLISLKKPLKTTAWYIGKRGQVYKKTKLLAKGSLVFATKDGKPVLVWSCGNPLRANLPLKIETASGPSVAAAPTQVAAAPVEVKVLATPIETVAVAAVTAAPAPAAVALTPIAAPPPLAVFAAPPVAVPPPLFSRLGLGWLLPLVGLFEDEPPHYVPEPSSLAALAAGVSMAPIAFGIRRRRARR
jgi:hypothetical protein